MSDRSSLHDAIEEALAAYDRRRAVDVAIGAIDDGSASIEDLHGVLSEILVEVGAGWQRGTVEVWQEHFVTGVVRNIVEACVSKVHEAAPQEPLATIVLAAPTDEYHDLGLRMLVDRLTLAGWRVYFLGAHVPVSELVSAVAELGADAVGLSASTHFHRARLEEYVATLSESHPQVRVWVGGPAFAHEHDGWLGDMILDPSTIPQPGPS